MPLEPGATLGPYEILSKIGESGMGAVYKARDTRLKMRCGSANRSPMGSTPRTVSVSYS